MKDRVQSPLCDILSIGGRGANLDEAAFCEFCQGGDVGVCDLVKASFTELCQFRTKRSAHNEIWFGGLLVRSGCLILLELQFGRGLGRELLVQLRPARMGIRPQKRTFQRPLKQVRVQSQESVHLVGDCPAMESFPDLRLLAIERGRAKLQGGGKESENST